MLRRLAILVTLAASATLAPPWVSPVRSEAGAAPGAPDPTTQAGARALEGAALLRQHRPSRLLLPEPDLPIRMSHRWHLDVGARCLDCHGGQAALSGPGVALSVRAADVSLPREEACLACHRAAASPAPPPPDPLGDAFGDPEPSATGAAARPAKATGPPASCPTCHVGYDPPLAPGVGPRGRPDALGPGPAGVRMEAPRVRMNHRRHLALGVACGTCHGRVDRLHFATNDNALPLMEVCLGCHDGVARDYRREDGTVASLAAPSACRTCHETGPDGRLRTSFPEGKLTPSGRYRQDAHDDAWLRTHSQSSRMGDGYCQSCHAPNECLDCHQGVKKPIAIHPNNWVLGHPGPARRNDPDCASCHRAQTFCLDCHMASRVGGDPGPARPPSSVRFHPAGWATPGARGPDHHSLEAQRNLRACASCHTEQTCLACHAETGLGGASVNPHGPGFRARDCARMKAMNPRTCVRCHVPGSPQLDCR